MNGLREYERDLTLPAQAGDVELCPPSSERILDIVDGALRIDERVHVVSAVLCHARWKPRTSVAATYSLRCDDGSEHLVTWKRYAGDKAEMIARSGANSAASTGSTLLDQMVWPDEHVVMSTFPHDRALDGLGIAFDAKRVCRALSVTAPFIGKDLRYRHSSSSLVRYKPERRAVVRFDAALRDSERRLTTTSVGLRVLPPTRAAEIARDRRASGLESLGLAPRLLGHEARAGLLLEEWLSVIPLAHDDFSCAAELGTLVARLNALPCARVVKPARAEGPRDFLALFEVDRAAFMAARSIAERAPRAAYQPSWTHGDVHPDQTAREAGTADLRLLDWDSIAVGDPLQDVASFAADTVISGASAAESQFLDSYRAAGGAPFTECELNQAVARALSARAAGSLRRLERGAVATALGYFTMARERLEGMGSAR